MNKLGKYDDLAKVILEDWKVPGMAVAIVQDGAVVHSSGYGYRDLENRNPVDENTVFAIGSTSKAFTGATVGILVDRGLLDWYEPVRKYIPEFALRDPFAAERMTVRDLLSHRSGLPRHDALWYGSPFSRKELIQRLQYLQPSADFRTAFQYQNLMFMTAGYLVGKISGQTWEVFTEENILKPLGMTGTSLSVEGIRENGNAAKPYSTGQKGHKLLEYRNLDAISPAGGINSCLKDLVKWLRVHLEGGSCENVRIISGENLRQIHTPVTYIENAHSRMLQHFPEIGPESYALGWFVHEYRGHKLVRHGGHIDGFSTQISFMPDINAGVIVLSNIGGSSFMFAPTFLAYDMLLELPQLDWSGRIKAEVESTRKADKQARKWFDDKRVRRSKPSHALGDYVGAYLHPAYGRVEISLKKDRLRAKFNNRHVDLAHYHYDVFNWSTGRPNAVPLKIRFSCDVLGKIESVSIPLEPNVDPIRFERVPDPKLYEGEFLSLFLGSYVWEGNPARVAYIKDRGLMLYMADFPEMFLDPYDENLFRVKNHYGWFVEFSGEPVDAFHLIQPSAAFYAEKRD